jgi:hypothetical protein
MEEVEPISALGVGVVVSVLQAIRPEIAGIGMFDCIRPAALAAPARDKLSTDTISAAMSSVLFDSSPFGM